MLTRRSFLQTASFVSTAPLLPAIFSRTARAAGSAPDARTLVVIQLDGGNDGINTVVPYADDAYGRARVKLRLEQNELHKLDDHVALHPAMRAAKELFDDGRLAVVQGVGYPNPNRSHFESMRIWQTASFDKDQHDSYGWLGRALDRGSANRVDAQPGSSIFIGGGDTPVTLWARKSASISLTSAEDLELTIPPELQGATIPAAPEESLRQFVGHEVLAAYAAARDFTERRRGRRAETNSGYPTTELGSQLQLVSQLLQGAAGARVYYVLHPGFDTHAAQLNTHYHLLRELSAALKAFLDDLRAAQLDDRVVVLCFSEFGRRVSENDSQGTDHGAAGPVMLAGSPLRGGLVGAPPNLTDLEHGDLKMQIDFRQVYATLLDQWLAIPSRHVLGTNYDPLPLFTS